MHHLLRLRPLTILNQHLKPSLFYVYCIDPTARTSRPTYQRRNTSSVPSIQAPTSPVTLRPYQEECVDTCIKVLTAGVGLNRIGVSLPPASGKTTLFCSLVSRLPPPKDRLSASKALVIVGSIELAKQAAARFSLVCPHLTVEIEQGQAHQATGLADVTIATYQTLNKLERRSKFDPNLFKVVIVDEAHHSVAKSYIHTLSIFNSAIVSTNRSESQSLDAPVVHGHSVPVVGFSATFFREDKLELGSVFQNIVYHRGYNEMMQEGWLSPITCTAIRADIDLSTAVSSKNEYNFAEDRLALIMNTDSLNTLAVQVWQNQPAMPNSTLVFCVNISHVEAITAMFQKSGVDARSITTNTPEKERQTLLSAFFRGEFPVFVNCSILTEGIDLPNTDCIMILRPTRSRPLFAQIIGRGMRLHPESGKKECHVIDFVDQFNRVAGVMSAPVLFPQVPSGMSTAQKDTSTSSPRNSARPSVPLLSETSSDGNMKYTQQESTFLYDIVSGSNWQAPPSNLAWVQISPRMWVLECFRHCLMLVEETEDPRLPAGLFRFETYWFQRNIPEDRETKWAFSFRRSKRLESAFTLTEAMRRADRMVMGEILSRRAVFQLRRSASWRTEPVTAPQIKVISSLYEQRFPSKRNGAPPGQNIFSRALPFELSTSTRGQAFELITRLKWTPEDLRRLLRMFTKFTNWRERAREGGEGERSHQSHHTNVAHASPLQNVES